MSKLRNRIARQAGAAAAAGAAMHPYGTPDTPMMMPMIRVQFSGGGAAVQQMAPLITANGAPVPATVPGHYGHVAIAGGGRY